MALGNICTSDTICFNPSDYENSCPVFGQNYFGQDAHYKHKCTPISLYLDSTNDDEKIVVDNNTGLQWQMTQSQNTFTWKDAYIYCDTLNYGGYSDWRLPNPQELQTYGTYGYLWTSDYVWTSNKAFYANFEEINYTSKTSMYKARCVRGKELPPASLTFLTTDNGDVIAVDSTTNLVWQAAVADSNSKKSWNNALQYCQNLTYGGYSNWRLPNKNELLSLLNYNKSSVPYSEFTSRADYYWSNYYWSSSYYNYDYSTSGIWVVDLYNGTLSQRDHYNISYYSEYIICVRNSECPVEELLNGGKCRLNLGNICTGQNRCYNNSSSITCPPLQLSSFSFESADFFGQDAYYASLDFCTSQNFTQKTLDSYSPDYPYQRQKIVTDNNTGLTWEIYYSSLTNSPDYQWQNREEHCNELNSLRFGNIDTWRVPNPLELLTIADHSRKQPSTNPIFTNISTDGYIDLWTSKEKNTSEAYSFSTSSVTPAYKNHSIKVMCVSGDEFSYATSEDFEESSDGKTVKDLRTGLIWQKEYVQINSYDSEDKTWKEALAYCDQLNNINYGGYSKWWRLPNKNELLSLINYDKSEAPYSYFPNMPTSSREYWTSTTWTDYSSLVFIIDFSKIDDDVPYRESKSSQGYVRCVR